MSREVRIGEAGRGRAHGGERPEGAAAYGGKGFKERARVRGERPIGVASRRQQHNQASCHYPPPTPPTAVTFSPKLCVLGCDGVRLPGMSGLRRNFTLDRSSVPSGLRGDTPPDADAPSGARTGDLWFRRHVQNCWVLRQSPPPRMSLPHMRGIRLREGHSRLPSTKTWSMAFVLHVSSGADPSARQALLSWVLMAMGSICMADPRGYLEQTMPEIKKVPAAGAGAGGGGGMRGTETRPGKPAMCPPGRRQLHRGAGSDKRAPRTGRRDGN